MSEKRVTVSCRKFQFIRWLFKIAAKAALRENFVKTSRLRGSGNFQDGFAKSVGALNRESKMSFDLGFVALKKGSDPDNIIC